MRRLLLPLCAALFVAISLPALEIVQDDIRLELDERSSRFGISVRQDDEWVSLLYPDDLRTSAMEILEENRVFRMGDSGQFSQRLVEESNGARFEWRSPTLEVTQSFRFLRGRTLAAGAVEIRTTIVNRGETERAVGVRYLLDTYLGERSNEHFRLPNDQVVSRELLVESASSQFVTSRQSADSPLGFQLMVSGSEISLPESVYLANWQRASESSWEFQYNPTRNYNRLPFSINDSAILVNYETKRIAPGERYEIVTHLGNLSAAGYSELPATTVTVPAVSEPESDVSRAELIARLSELVGEIALLSGEESIDIDDLIRLQQELQTLGELIRGR